MNSSRPAKVHKLGATDTNVEMKLSRFICHFGRNSAIFTTRSSFPRYVDGRLTERSAAFPARATPVSPHEPSLRHVCRLHDILTAGLLCVQPTVQLSSPRETQERPRQPSSRNVAVSTTY
ncbi:hypothetical protein LSAT2_030089 [Lamellibrachia satsuma]|nr:hypothetical protein LSAT2_030089 [Lamellibrachia satsuma]